VDQIYRFGGEEFVVLLPGLDQEGAARAAERLIEAVRANAFLEDVSKGELKLTASIGGSIYPDQADNETQLFRLADESCYRAKHEGKDRVVFSSP
jgi:diguanylate cyclase (GGDEF)-like protein